MWLYVISEGAAGPCKIGFADRVEHRLTCLQSGNPRLLTLEFKMECVNYRKAERIAHYRAGYRNVVLGEWFGIPVVDAVNAVKQACHLAAVALKRQGDYGK